jgi:hypothetical protein
LLINIHILSIRKFDPYVARGSIESSSSGRWPFEDPEIKSMLLQNRADVIIEAEAFWLFEVASRRPG